MENPNPKTFNLAEMFAGISFPEEVVEVFTNPGVAYAYSLLAQEATAAVQKGDEDALKDIEVRQKRLLEEAEKFRYEIHLQGVMQDVLSSVRDKALSEYPPQKSAPQIPGFPAQVEYTDEFYKCFNLLTWQVLIRKIVAPSGAEVISPDAEFVGGLIEKLPPSEHDRVSQAIRRFSDGAKSGFESIVQERDFLSKASSEA